MKIHCLLLILILHCFLAIGANSFIRKKKRNIEFVENRGQVHDQFGNSRNDVLFHCFSNNLLFLLRANGISYQQYRVLSWKDQSSIDDFSCGRCEPVPDQIGIYRVDIEWLNTNPHVMFTSEKATSKVHYYNAQNPDGIINVGVNNSVTYRNIYDKINLRFYGKENDFEYDFILEPGADPNEISWVIKGVDRMFVNEKGQLILETVFGIIIEEKPIAFQGKRRIEAKWKVNGDIVSFEVGRYDKNKDLVIDPIVRQWGTYMGGLAQETGWSVAFDDSSNVFASGITYSNNNIATIGAHQTSIAGNSDAYLVKYNSNGQKVWATYYGGLVDDISEDCAVDKDGYVYLSGYTASAAGISSSGSFQDSIAGGYDGFIAKFKSNGIRLWATYFGAALNESLHGITTDNQYDVYIAGETNSDTMLATPGSHQDTYVGVGAAFLAKFDSTGSIIWCTYYDGNWIDIGRDCAVDDSLNVYLTGITESTSNIATVGAHQTMNAGGINTQDNFLVKFNSSGVRQWATYYGGMDTEFKSQVDCGPDGEIYLASFTESGSMISSSSSHQSSFGGGQYDVYLAKFSGSGVRQWATYYGGTSFDQLHDCKTDINGNVYISGYTSSPNAISTPGSHQETYNLQWDGFVAKFNSSGQRTWGTYYGGPFVENVYGMDVDDDMNVVITGQTSSNTFIATPNGDQTTVNGSPDAFIAKFDHCENDSVNISIKDCQGYISPSGKNVFYTSGIYIDTLANVKGCDSILRIDFTVIPNDSVYSIGDTIVAYTDSAQYQWIECFSDSIISGVKSRSYSPTKSGSYAVIIEKMGCIDTSSCIDVQIVGIDESQLFTGHLYPNPTIGPFTINFSERLFDVTLTIKDTYGRRLSEAFYDEALSVGATITGSNGIYFVLVKSNGKVVERFKIMKQ